MRSTIHLEITADIIKAAKENPNGWVYKIEGEFKPGQDIPPEAIVGAWKVDKYGNIEGGFIKNLKYVCKADGQDDY